MCCWYNTAKQQSVQSVHTSEGEINEDSNRPTCELPEHFDNAFLNRNVQSGILGFYYETKNTSFLVYSSIEAKTFCILMKLKPICN